ncbi:hypothetical protein GCM10009767_23860 [Kocuria aegyptia]|uniref:Uncharacterized protein n=1 Tax=Kocuria aegyptia TaxID=330943 RepID=A0ABP4WW32_9MICC
MTTTSTDACTQNAARAGSTERRGAAPEAEGMRTFRGGSENAMSSRQPHGSRQADHRSSVTVGGTVWPLPALGAQGPRGSSGRGARGPAYGTFCRCTISAIHTGAYGDVQFGGVG